MIKGDQQVFSSEAVSGPELFAVTYLEGERVQGYNRDVDDGRGIWWGINAQ